jgi:hypothetical protein
MMRRIGITPFMLLGSCSMAPDGVGPPPTAGTVETIRYETGRCFGTCPVFVLTARSDGTATFEGKQFTAVQGVRDLSITPAQYAEFRNRLQPYRPPGERRLSMDAECNGRVATDMPSVDVTWTAKGPQAHLYVNYGCDMERNAAMFEALRQAPDAIPEVQALIGKY